MTSSTPDNVTFLIVPGAWQTPWHYQTLVASVEKLGHRAVCLAHPTCHIDAPFSETAQDDVSNVAAAIEQEAKAGRQVVLVMHSYGGAPGSEACKGLLVDNFRGRGAEGGVKKLVYIAAVVFGEGQGISEEMKANLRLVLHDDSSTTHEDPAPVLYSDVPEPLQSQAVANMSKQSAGALSFTCSFAPWKHVPAHYMITERDASVPVPVQRFISSQEGGKWSTSSLETGHCPSLVSPDLVAKRIVDFAIAQ